MHQRINSGPKFWALVSVLLSLFILALWQIDAGSTNESKRMYSLNEEFANKCDYSTNEPFENKCVNLYIQSTGVDAEKQYLEGNLYFYPPEKYATSFGSSVQTLAITDIYLDAARLDTGGLNENLYYEKFDYIRLLKFSIDMTNSEFESRYQDTFYPFDRYSGELSGSISFFETEDTSETERIYLPVISNEYSSVVSGWKIELDYDYLNSDLPFASGATERQESGNFYNVFRVERSDLTKAIVGIFGFIFLGGAFSLLVLLKSILLSHKRPTITGLVWAGSTTFTLIQTRGLLPGNPRPGVLFDLVVFYPALMVCFITSVIILKLWVSHEDFRFASEE